MPCGQLFESIRLYQKDVFLASVVNNIAIELELKDVVLIEDIGMELTESRLRDSLA